MRQVARRWIRLGLGWVLVAAGTIGLVLPLPGMLVFCLGLAILASESALARRLAAYLRTRFPKLGAALDGATARPSRLGRRNRSAGH